MLGRSAIRRGSYACAALGAVLILSAAAPAEDSRLDLGDVTCSELSASAGSARKFFVFWFGGYVAQKLGATVFGADQVKHRLDVVLEACQTDPTQKVLPLILQAGRSASLAMPAVSSGTGFLVSSDGEILTANHLVEGAGEIAVTLPDGRTLAARVTKSSAALDLAVLRVDATELPYLGLASLGSANVGDPVFTMLLPVVDVLGREPKFTEGAISSLSGLKGDASFMQISVPVQPGNSGGPLVNDPWRLQASCHRA